jgi:hypothetical protein
LPQGAGALSGDQNQSTTLIGAGVVPAFVEICSAGIAG